LGSHSESQQGTPDVLELGPAGTVGALLELIDPAPGPVDVRPALPRPALFLETEKLGLLEVLLAGEGSKQGVVQHIAGKLAAGLVRVERLQAIGDDVGQALGLPVAGEQLPGDLDALLPAAPIDREGGIVEPGREHQHLALGPVQLSALRDLLGVVDQRAVRLKP
jgi:hypothetical protein